MNFNFFNNNLTINIMLLIIFIVLIVLSGFFSSTEAAFSSANPLRLKSLLDEKRRGAKKAVSIADRLDYALVTLWICRSLVDITLTVIAGYFIYNIIEKVFLSALLTVVIAGFIIIVFGQSIPKQNAVASPEKTALKNSAIMYMFFKLFYPLTFILLKFKKSVFKNNESNLTPKVTEEELGTIIDTMETEGVFNEEDAELIQSAIGLSDKTVYDIMTPRVDIVAIEENMSLDRIKEVFFVNHFSRVPVYREDKDQIIGILSEKDFFTVLLKNQEVVLEDLVSKPYFVSESTKVNDLIKEFQKLKKHFAVVVDEYGGTSGIVTMEDALEELVGEIYDEYDEEELEDITKIDDNLYTVSAEMEIEDLFDFLNIDDLPNTQYNTVGGFVYSLIGGMPAEEMEVSYDYIIEVDNIEIKYTLEFTIKVVENKRIRLVQLSVRKFEDDKEVEEKSEE